MAGQSMGSMGPPSTSTDPDLPLHVEMSDHVYASIAKPLHIQRVEHALDVEPLLNYLEESVARAQFSDFEPSTDGDSDLDAYKKAPIDAEGNRLFNGMVVTRAGWFSVEFDDWLP